MENYFFNKRLESKDFISINYTLVFINSLIIQGLDD